MKKIYFLILALATPPTVIAAQLTPFSTDGCSAFPEGTIEQQSLWFDCCISHDMAYWKGGTAEQRQQADSELQQCVSQLGEPYIAKLMHAGVRIGGTPYAPTPFRWGYGWPYARGYKALDEGEKEQVRTRLKEFQLLIKHISDKVEAQLDKKKGDQ